MTGFCRCRVLFLYGIQRCETSVIGWTIAPCFSITLHSRDLALLEAIQAFFKGVGRINVVGKTASSREKSRADLLVIIEHFKNYPFQTSKLVSFFVLLQNIGLNGF